VVNPDIVKAQIEGAIIFGVTAALYGAITLKNGRVEQTNFDTYQMLRINEAPAIEVHIVRASSRRAGWANRGPRRSSPRSPTRSLRRPASVCESFRWTRLS
jgi:isoquinoline 1-oxidoreductase beta subunit